MTARDLAAEYAPAFGKMVALVLVFHWLAAG